MRVLVTGGHGFVGSHLVDLLEAKGDQVRCLLRRPEIPAILRDRCVEIVKGDVRDPDAAACAVEGVDEIHHLAALTRSFTRRQMIETNVGGTVHLLQAAARAGFAGRFVFCSSLAAAGPSPDGRPLTEDAPCRPLTWYGESKREAEAAARTFQDRLALTVIRPPAVYGPRDTDFLSVFRAAARGLHPVFGGGSRVYSFVFPSDLAEGMLAAARNPACVGRTYYVAHPECLILEEFLERISRAIGRPGRRITIPAAAMALLGRLGDLAAQLLPSPPLVTTQRVRELSGLAWIFSPAALERDTGWRARVDAAAGTARTVAWCREQGLLPAPDTGLAGDSPAP